MITIKSKSEIEKMRVAGKITGDALKLIEKHIKQGVSTLELDKIAFDYIKSQGETPGFLNYNGFPASACISINNEVIHGIPSKKRIVQSGDIVSVDLGAVFEGYNGDNAATFASGDISPDARRLLDTTEHSRYEGITAVKRGGRIGDIGSAVQRYVEARGYSVVRDFVGHGVGASLHESPEVPNFGKEGHGVRLMPGMTIAIEPMVNQKGYEVNTLSDGWTVVTKDEGLSAHFEHTVAVTDDGPIILTKI